MHSILFMEHFTGSAGRTAEGVRKLGDMMRFMLEENQQDKIPLGKELTYLTNYIELQNYVRKFHQTLTFLSSKPNNVIMKLRRCC